MTAVPDRLEDRVGEPGVHDVLHRFLAQIVVDPIDPILGEVPVKHCIKPGCRGGIATEGLLHHDPRPLGAARGRQALSDHLEERRRDRQVIDRSLSRTKLGAQPEECVLVAVVTTHI